MDILRQVFQVVIAAGLLNVWLLRSSKSTPYRGGAAQSMREEFAVYNLPAFMMYLVGALKVIIALTMIAGIWLQPLIAPSAALLVLLMLGAFSMHIKVKDPLAKSIPSVLMLGMAVTVLLLAS